MTLAKRTLNAQFKMRQCMTEFNGKRCPERFLSTHAGHRHCKKCLKSMESNPFDDSHAVHI